MAFTLTLIVTSGMLASTFRAKTTTDTIRAQLINVPARLPAPSSDGAAPACDRPWETAWTQLSDSARHGPTLAA